MKRGGGILLRVGMIVAVMAGLMTQAVPAGALSAVEPAPIAQTSPLYITSYQRTLAGAKLGFVELHNTDKSVININGWSLQSGGQTIAAFDGGLIEPGGYVVLSSGDYVVNATIRATLNAPIVNDVLTLIPPIGSSYASTQYDLKRSGGGGTVESMWTRTTTQTGYSSSASSFAVSARQPYDSGFYVTPTVPGLEIVEIYPYSSDCSPFDKSALCGDYVKFRNTTGKDMIIENIVLRTDSGSVARTASNTISLDGVEIKQGEYKSVWLTDTDQRLNLTNSGGYIWLEDTWGLARYDTTLTKYESASSKQQGYAWAKNSDGTWQWTSTPSPNSSNVFTMPAVVETTSLGECPAGKYRNPETNRCRTIEEAVNALAACPEGQERNAATNRCRSTASAASASLTPCKEGQERNPTTNRCRSIASAVAELLPCDEGYERNPATNRCRKSQSSEIPGAAFPVEPVKDAANAAIAWWAVGGILLLGAGYGAWEWRHEILGGMRKVFTRGKIE